MDRRLAPYAITINTFEAGSRYPAVTHTFWGETFDEAFGVAKAHLISDYFFSASFEGEMKWAGSDEEGPTRFYIELYNDGRLAGRYPSTGTELNINSSFDMIHDDLANLARRYNDQKYALGVVDGILKIAERQ